MNGPAAPVVGVPPGRTDPDRTDPDRPDAVAQSPVTPLTPIGERVRQLTFGPSALLTPANGITVARLLATPVVVVMVVVTMMMTVVMVMRVMRRHAFDS